MSLALNDNAKFYFLSKMATKPMSLKTVSYESLMMAMILFVGIVAELSLIIGLALNNILLDIQ